MNPRKTPERLQRWILIYSALMILVIGFTTAAVSLIPFYQRAKVNQRQNLLFALQTRTLAINQYLARAEDVAWQVSSRSAVREQLEKYNQGEISRSELISFNTPKLEDALIQSQEVAGIVQIAKKGEFLIEIGKRIPQNYWLIPEFGNSATIQFWPVPVTIDSQDYLVISTPILDKAEQLVGSNLILFRLADLKKIVQDHTGLGKTGKIVIGRVFPEQVQLFFNPKNIPLSPQTTLVMKAAASGERGIMQASGAQSPVIAYAPLETIDWVILLQVSPQELYASVNKQIILISTVLVLLLILGTQGMILLLRPLIKELRQEISDRQQAEAALVAILDNAEDAIITIDAAQQITLFNKGAEKIFGYTASTVLGESIDILIPLRYLPSHQQYVDEFVSNCASTAKVRKMYGRRQDGSEFPGEASVSQLTLADKKLYTVIMRDISDRQKAEQALWESEAKFRSLTNDVLDSSAVGIFILDADFKVVWVNQALELFFGIPRQQIIGKDKKELIKQRIKSIFVEPEVFASHVLATYDNNTYIENFECHIFAQGDRQERWLEHWSQPIRSGLYIGGRIEHYTDITERKHIEEELAARAQALTQSNQELEQFAYVASHDLQEPLRAVISYTDLLAEEYQGQLDSEADEYIHFITDGAIRMKQLIQDLLSFSRVGTRGKEFQPTSMTEVLAEVKANLAMSLAESSAVIICNSLPTVNGDRSQLVQLWQNLISNSIKFCAAKTPYLEIACIKSEEHWLFSLKDNGIGIEDQYKERIFVIFQRLHTRTQYPGTGIGLAICRKIVERHGGKIWVESEFGQGSTFYFTLPLV